MASEVKAVGARGLTTGVNPLVAQSNSFYQLTNAVSDFNGWAVKRRGFKNLNRTSSYSSVITGGGASFYVKQIWSFDDHIFVYVEADSPNGSGISSAICAYSMVTNAGWHKVVESTGYIALDRSQFKMRSSATDRRQLITTAAGVKRIAGVYADYYPAGSTTAVNYSAMYRDAGIPRALDPRCRSDVASGGSDHGLIAVTGFEWLGPSSAVAYRICWIKRDENAILGYGDPSGRIVVRNTNTTTSYATRLKVNVPSAVSDTSFVMQIYRTNVIEMDATGVIPDPGDDMFLVGEYRATSTDLLTQYILYEDVSFDGLLGDALYTNENQEGPLAGRKQPPICRDISYFNNTAFFSNTTEKQRMLIKLLAVDPSGVGTYKGVRVGDVIVAGDLVMEAVAPASEETQSHYFSTDQTTGVGSEVIRAIKTAESFCYKYNYYSNSVNGRYYAYNLTTNNDIVGIIQLEEKSIGGSVGAYVGTTRVDSPVQILPAPVFTSTPSDTLALKCAVATDVTGLVVTVTAAANHNLTTGDLVFISPYYQSVDTTDIPRFNNTQLRTGIYKITTAGATQFTITLTSAISPSSTDANTATTGGYFHKIFDTTSSVWTEARTSNNRRPNRLMWSPIGEPECAPLVNFVDIGAADKSILRTFPTADSLFIFKEDGLWRLKGFDGDFEIISIDQSCVCAAPNSVAGVGGRVFAYTTTGVVMIDDGGVQKISGDVGGFIEFRLRAITSNPAASVHVIGAGRDEEQTYWIGAQNDGEYSEIGQYAEIFYRYHIPTKTWSKHYIRDNLSLSTVEGKFGGMCSVKASRYTTFDAQAYSERLILGGAQSTYIAVERRSLMGTTIELCDADIDVTVFSMNSSAGTVTFTAAGGVDIGDVFMWHNPTGGYAPGGYYSGAAEYVGVITAVNAGVYTLESIGPTPMSGWPAVGGAYVGSVLQSIPSTYEYTGFSAGGSFDSAHASEVVVSTGSKGEFGSATLSFSGDVSSAGAADPATGTGTISGYVGAMSSGFATKIRDERNLSILRSFRCGVPRAVSMATTLRVAITHKKALQAFDLAGVRVVFSDAGKTRRTNA